MPFETGFEAVPATMAQSTPEIPRRARHRFDGVDLSALAAIVPTPFYAYSASAIRERRSGLRSAFHGLDLRICYAVKATQPRDPATDGPAGVGADIVSLGEMQRSLKAGIPAGCIVFSGVGKTGEEIAAALAAGVWRFNVESAGELALLQCIASERGVTARAAVRINLDVDASMPDFR